MSIESGSTRNTLGSQLSTTSSSGSSGDSSSKGTSRRKKEYWKKDRKIIRILTVVAYIASVSMAAVLLSAYYVFIWTSDNMNAEIVKQHANKIKITAQSSSTSNQNIGISTDSSVSQAAAFTSSHGPSGVLDLLQPYTTKTTTTPINQRLLDDTGIDDDEYQHQPQIINQRIETDGTNFQKQEQIPVNNYNPRHLSGSNKSKAASPSLTSPLDSIYYSHPKEDKGEEEEEGGEEEHLDPIALPLNQNLITSSSIDHSSERQTNAATKTPSTTTIAITTSTSNNNNNNINSSNKSSSPSSETEPETFLINRANTLPYRQRQIPTPSAPLLITKMISSSVLSPTTTTIPSSSSSLSSLENESKISTQPMMSLLMNVSRLLIDKNVNNNNNNKTKINAKYYESTTKSPVVVSTASMTETLPSTESSYSTTNIKLSPTAALQ